MVKWHKIAQAFSYIYIYEHAQTGKRMLLRRDPHPRTFLFACHINYVPGTFAHMTQIRHTFLTCVRCHSRFCTFSHFLSSQFNTIRIRTSNSLNLTRMLNISNGCQYERELGSRVTLVQTKPGYCKPKHATTRRMMRMRFFSLSCCYVGIFHMDVIFYSAFTHLL